jgi:hypothetical protein
MEAVMDHTKPWLKFVDVAEVSDQTLDLNHMKVRNRSGDDLGVVDGLVVDAETGRPRYVVVDAGGWFKSKHFLAPIGQIHLDSDRDALIVSLTKEQINGFPGFDTDDFDALDEEDVKRLNTKIDQIYEPDARYPSDEPYSAAWNRASYRLPEWWNEASGFPRAESRR